MGTNDREKKIVVFQSEVDAFLAEKGIRLATKRRRKNVAEYIRMVKGG